MGRPKSGIMIAGAIFAVLGVLAIAIPVFTTQQTKDVARIGDLRLTAKEETTHAEEIQYRKQVERLVKDSEMYRVVFVRTP